MPQLIYINVSCNLKMKFISITVLFFNLLTLSAQNTKTELIEFNGIYETKCYYDKDDDEGTQDYLRFYPNGNVISISTDCDGTADELKDWFNMEMEHLSVGKYEFNGKKIEFTTASKVGKVQYIGRITKSGILKLRSTSHINGYKNRVEYHFVKVEGLK